MTQWRAVPGFDGEYEVSDDGQVRSLLRVVTRSDGRTRTIRPRVLHPNKMKKGHMQVSLWRGNREHKHLVHRLVLLAFVSSCPPGLQALHGNGIAWDNRVENLRWGTISENSLDSVKHGTHPAASKTHCKRGHPLSGDNLRYAKRGGRICIQCDRASKRAWQRRNYVAR